MQQTGVYLIRLKAWREECYIAEYIVAANASAPLSLLFNRQEKCETAARHKKQFQDSLHRQRLKKALIDIQPSAWDTECCSQGA